MPGLLEQPVSAVMKRDFATAKREDRLDKVFELMAKSGVLFVPVVDDFGVAIGTISERDLAKVLNSPAVGAIMKFSEEIIHECLKKPVKDIMTHQPITLEESARVSDALRIFANNHIHFIPVINKGGVVVGILSLLDIISHERK